MKNLFALVAVMSVFVVLSASAYAQTVSEVQPVADRAIIASFLSQELNENDRVSLDTNGDGTPETVLTTVDEINTFLNSRTFYLYFAGQDIVNAFELASGSAYLVDGYGGIHSSGTAPKPLADPAIIRSWLVSQLRENGVAFAQDAGSVIQLSSEQAIDAYMSGRTFYLYFPENNIIRDIELTPSGNGIYLLDGYGGIHTSGDADPSLSAGEPYWPEFDIAQDIEVSSSGIYLLDAYGAIHTKGAGLSLLAGSPSDAHYYRNKYSTQRGNEYARDIEIYRDAAGAELGMVVLYENDIAFSGAVPESFHHAAENALARYRAENLGAKLVDMQVTSDGIYLMDEIGFVYTGGSATQLFADAPALTQLELKSGSRGIAKDIELVYDGTRVVGYDILDGFGKLHEVRASARALSILSVTSTNSRANQKNLIIEARDKSDASSFYKVGEFSRETNSFISLRNSFDPSTQMLAIGANAPSFANRLIAEQVLTITLSDNSIIRASIPQVTVPANKFVRLYVAADGSTYYLHPDKFGQGTSIAPYSANAIASSPSLLSSQLARSRVLSIAGVSSTSAAVNSIGLSITIHPFSAGTAGYPAGILTARNVFRSNVLYNSFEPGKQVIGIGINSGNSGKAIIAEQTVTITLSDSSVIRAFIPRTEIPEGGHSFRFYVGENGLVFYQDSNKDGTGTRYTPNQIAGELYTQQLARSVQTYRIVSAVSPVDTDLVVYYVFPDSTEPVEVGHFEGRSFVSSGVDIPVTATLAIGTRSGFAQPFVLKLLTSSDAVSSIFIPSIAEPAEGARVMLYVDTTGSTIWQDTNRDGTGARIAPRDLSSAQLAVLLARQSQSLGTFRVIDAVSTDTSGNTRAINIYYDNIYLARGGVQVGSISIANSFSGTSANIPVDDVVLLVGFDGSGSLAGQALTISTDVGETLTFTLPPVSVSSSSAKFRLYIMPDGRLFHADTNKDGTGSFISAYAASANSSYEFRVVTPPAQPAPSSGGGSSGSSDSGTVAAGGTTRHVRTFNNIEAGEPLVIRSIIGGIRSVNFSLNKNIDRARFVLETVTGVPSVYEGVEGRLFSAFTFTSSDVSASDIQSVKFSFRILSSWLQKNNVTENDIYLYSYENGRVVIIKATPLERQGGYQLFEASAKALGQFAIFASATTPSQPTQPSGEGTTNQTSNQTGEQPPATGQAASSSSATLIAAVVIIIIVILVIVYFGREKPEGKKHKNNKPKDDKSTASIAREM